MVKMGNFVIYILLPFLNLFFKKSLGLMLLNKDTVLCFVVGVSIMLNSEMA